MEADVPTLEPSRESGFFAAAVGGTIWLTVTSLRVASDEVLERESKRVGVHESGNSSQSAGFSSH